MNNSIPVTIILVLLAFAGGVWLGDYRTTSTIIEEVDSWHTARLWEDGSWRVEYRNGRIDTGCAITGLCQD